MPAKGKAVRFADVFVTRFESGQITEVRDYHDDLGVMAQLGLAPQGGP